MNNTLIVSKGSGKYSVISMDSFNEESTISLSGSHIAFSPKFSRYYTYEKKEGSVYDENKKLENHFDVESAVSASFSILLTSLISGLFVNCIFLSIK